MGSFLGRKGTRAPAVVEDRHQNFDGIAKGGRRIYPRAAASGWRLVGRPLVSTQAGTPCPPVTGVGSPTIRLGSAGVDGRVILEGTFAILVIGCSLG